MNQHTSFRYTTEMSLKLEMGIRFLIWAQAQKPNSTCRAFSSLWGSELGFL